MIKGLLTILESTHSLFDLEELKLHSEHLKRQCLVVTCDYATCRVRFVQQAVLVYDLVELVEDFVLIFV